MTKKERMQAVTERLKQVYPEAVCALHYTHDYELLFATRLSAQCTDARVNIVTEKLFSDFPTLESFAEASEEEIAEDIRSCGLFRTKARDLHACAVVLLAEYGGRVPDTMEELLRLPGDAAVFAGEDASAVPAWAQSAVSALSEAGIPLASDYEAPLTRREAANMLLAAEPVIKTAGLYWTE